MRILELFELEEWCFLFSLLISLDIIQGPPFITCSNLLVVWYIQSRVDHSFRVATNVENIENLEKIKEIWKIVKKSQGKFREIWMFVEKPGRLREDVKYVTWSQMKSVPGKGSSLELLRGKFENAVEILWNLISQKGHYPEFGEYPNHTVLRWGPARNHRKSDLSSLPKFVAFKPDFHSRTSLIASEIFDSRDSC